MPVDADAPDAGRHGVCRLLRALGPDADAAAALRPALDRLDWLAALPSAAAPGFVYLAGACGGVSVGGGGATLIDAARRLAGETAEVCAQLAPPAASDAPADPAIDAVWATGPMVVRVNARSVSRGDLVGVPAAAIHLDPFLAAQRGATAPPTSLGLAAGPDRAAARLAALLEVIERDAAAGWWCFGSPARQLDATLAGAAASLLARLRAGASPARTTTFIRLDAPAGVPVTCAISRDADGAGLAFGLKAALDSARCVAGALVEMLQMELALEMARRRAARGPIGPADSSVLARAALDPDAFAAFAARLPAAGDNELSVDFATLAARLAADGLAVSVADLPGPGSLAVAKVFVPGLRPLPGGGMPPRVDAPGARAALM